ncbi:hypothetical protein RIVM261_024670 [Rivularia sp. IAM M-261]|nr:hypothetical protein RIVM261_024670 [Rivularia sp. IAM M-261]
MAGKDACSTRIKTIYQISMQETNLKATERNLPHWELDGATYFITFNTWQKLKPSLVKYA